ncbi:MAG: transcription termination factor NusA [bacterium]
MNLTEVIDSLVEERGLSRESVATIVCEGIAAAYEKKYPGITFLITLNKKTGQLETQVEKEIVESVEEPDFEISLRKARSLSAKAQVGDRIVVPFEEPIGRIEIISAKQFIANKIRSLEQLAIYNDFIAKKDTIVSGIVHKKERAGWVVKFGEVLALLPREAAVEVDAFKVGHQIKALLKEVLPVARGDYQLILDRASADFVKHLIELEIPEVFEGVVEIKKIVRVAGYKTKAIVDSSSKEIDPVGTCVGVGGSRIKPILRELGHEKIDLIEYTTSLDDLVKDSLKPAVVDNVAVDESAGRAIVWLAQDQRSLAIGKMGQNISLASRLVGLDIQLQDLVQSESEKENSLDYSEEERSSDSRDRDANSNDQE